LTLKPLLCTSLVILTPLLVRAGTVSLVTGTPADYLAAAPTNTPSPNLGGVLLSFSTLTDFTTFSTLTQNGVTISSPDTLTVEPFSTQSNPNYLYDNGAGGDGDGTANITISVAGGVGAIGVGIADSDTIGGEPTDPPVNIELQPLGAGLVDLGSAFTVTIPENTVNAGNGYFVVDDTTPGLFGLQIIQESFSSETLNSGLAIADVQVSPEPSTFLLLIGGAAIIGSYRLRKKA
jgi:hypothetical protein